jgi:peptidoglycan hydrolase-like protein with peptidoglycan-binding domain
MTTGTEQPADGTVYLDRHGVRVTASWLDVPGRRYAIPALGELWTDRRPPGGEAIWVVRGLWVVLAVGVPATLLMDSLLRQLSILALLLVAVVAAATMVQASRHRMVLYACYEGRRELLFEADGPWLNQVQRALVRAYENASGEPSRTGDQGSPETALRDRHRPTIEATEYSILAGFGVLLLLASFAIAGVHRHADPTPAAPPSSVESEAQPTTAPPARTGTCDHVDRGYRPTLDLGAGTDDTDRTRQAVLQVQCLIINNSGYPGDVALDGVFGPETRDGVLWAQECNGIDQDGTVGDATWERLYSPDSGCGR